MKNKLAPVVNNQRKRKNQTLLNLMLTLRNLLAPLTSPNELTEPKSVHSVGDSTGVNQNLEITLL